MTQVRALAELVLAGAALVAAGLELAARATRGGCRTHRGRAAGHRFAGLQPSAIAADPAAGNHRRGAGGGRCGQAKALLEGVLSRLPDERQHQLTAADDGVGQVVQRLVYGGRNRKHGAVRVLVAAGIQDVGDRRARDQRPLHSGGAAILVELRPKARCRTPRTGACRSCRSPPGSTRRRNAECICSTQSTLTSSISPRMVTTVARCRQCARIWAPPQSKVQFPCRVATLLISSPIQRDVMEADSSPTRPIHNVPREI